MGSVLLVIQYRPLNTSNAFADTKTTEQKKYTTLSDHTISSIYIYIYVYVHNCQQESNTMCMLPKGEAYSRRFVRPSVRPSVTLGKYKRD